MRVDGELMEGRLVTGTLIGILSLLWGASYLLIDASLTGFSPTAVVAGRCALAALFLVPLAARAKAFTPLRHRRLELLGVVLVQSTVPLLLLTIGQRTVPPGLAGLLIGAQPLFVALLAYRFDPSERPAGGLGSVGLALGFAGLVLIFGFDLRTIPAGVAAGLLVTAAALSYAAGAILLHRRFANTPPTAVAASATSVTALVLIAPALITTEGLPSTGSIWALVALGTLCTAFSTTLFYWLVVRAGPARATLSFYLAPAVASVLDAVLTGHGLTWATTAGLVAIVAGSLLAGRRNSVP